MSVPPLRLGNSFDSYISGEVIIHPSAVIAPGVILQAAPNSKIIIGSGVCIGMGSILKVHAGTLEVEAGANLGAGFLMIGNGKIGTNACIGAATTVFNCSVESGQVVAPGSVIGDASRHISDSDAATGETQQPQFSTTNPASTSAESENGKEAQEKKEKNSPPLPPEVETPGYPNSPLPNNSALTTVDSQQSQAATESSDNNIGTHIYGQGSIQRLLVTLFPHRQSLNKPPSDDESE